MKILVTGAAGFIGSHLCERLRVDNHQVVGVDCFDPYYSVEFKQHTATSVRKSGVQFYELDLVEDNLQEVLDGVEVVFHVAAQPGNSAAVSLERYTRNNLFATEKLLQGCRELQSLQAFINVATSSVYGFYATSSEDEIPKPVSNYGVTKLAAEQLALSWHRNNGFPACSLRLFSVYGERERPEKLYPKLVQAITNDTPFPLFEGSMEHQRSFTYIGDVVQGFVSVLENWDKACGEVFNIGCDTTITTGQGIEIIEGILGKKVSVETLPKRWGDQVATAANINKAREMLGYEPATLPEEGLKRFVNWYREEISGKVPYKV